MKVQLIPRGEIRLDLNLLPNPREWHIREESGFALRIIQVGRLDQPIDVWFDGEHYYLVNGLRRWLALEWMEEHRPDEYHAMFDDGIECLVRTGDIEDVIVAAIVVNADREEYTPLEIANACEILRSRGYGNKKIAAIVNKDVRTVQRALEFKDKTDESVTELVREGVLKFSAACDVVKAPRNTWKGLLDELMGVKPHIDEKADPNTMPHKKRKKGPKGKTSSKEAGAKELNPRSPTRRKKPAPKKDGITKTRERAKKLGGRAGGKKTITEIRSLVGETEQQLKQHEIDGKGQILEPDEVARRKGENAAGAISYHYDKGKLEGMIAGLKWALGEGKDAS